MGSVQAPSSDCRVQGGGQRETRGPAPPHLDSFGSTVSLSEHLLSAGCVRD